MVKTTKYDATQINGHLSS